MKKGEKNMSTAKAFDIRDYDFLFEEELDAPETDAPQEPERHYSGAHVAPSAKQVAERNIRQARQTVTDTARKAQEKGSELWKSTENVRKNTARAAKEKSAQLWDSTADARKNARQTLNDSAQWIKEASASEDGRPLTKLEKKTKSYFFVCGAAAGLWIIQLILSFIPTIHMKVMDMISYEYHTFSLNTFWATNGGNGVDAAAILITLGMVILTILSIRSMLLAAVRKDMETKKLFILSKITAFFGIYYAKTIIDFVDARNRSTYGMADGTTGFAPSIYMFICILLLILGFVASIKNRRLRKMINTASAEQ